MVRKTRKTRQYRRKGQSLISADKINPQQWNISAREAKEALKAQGYQVKQIKKIRCLRHQVCISYWDEKGNICSSFFSYRIFTRWQKEVDKLVNLCPSLKELVQLNGILQYEFDYYSYPREMEDALASSIENRLSELKATARQTVLL
ncbi:MAG: hypothetical protein PUP92_00675 [Rhizonema sp. PD38]|nr:hypothetical protein [Rhizonema sp. PD38]